MRKFIVDKIYTLIIRNKEYSKLDDIKIRYGLEGTLMFLEKFIIVLILSLILNILYEVCIFMFFYMWIKLFSGGAHAKNSVSCMLISISIFIGIL